MEQQSSIDRSELRQILNMHTEAAFSIPIMLHLVADDVSDEVEKAFLEVESDLPVGAEENSPRTDFDLIGSSEGLIFDPINIKQFMDQLHEARKNYSRIAGLIHNPEWFTYWTTDYTEDGDTLSKRNYGSDGISGMYFIRADEGCSDVTFYNPNPHLKNSGLDTDYISKTGMNIFQMPQYTITPVKGLFVFFPSYLEHEVLPNPTGIHRTSFDFTFEARTARDWSSIKDK